MQTLKTILEKVLKEYPSSKAQPFGENPMAQFIRRDTAEYLSKFISKDDYKIIGHPGQGNWAMMPWIEIVDKTLNKNIIYVTYIFNETYDGVYLSLQVKQNNQKDYLNIKDTYISLIDKLDIPNQWSIGGQINGLRNTYEKTNLLAKFYEKGQIPEEKELLKDLNYLMNIYQNLISNNTESSNEVENITHISSMNIPKPFIILAGISGTGKTRFVREQAKSWSKNLDNYCLIPVRPDWHEPSDLLGYVSRLSSNPEYVVTDLLKFIVKAWKEIAQGVSFEEKYAKGTQENLAQIRPFWLCLDEMNLAPVEQYFADYLSILETREWQWDKNGFSYCSDALLSADLFKQFSSDFKQAFDLENDEKLVAFFEQNGVPLPFNLIVAGTVNMDETTHGFSRKVLDRALSFDFSEFYPNDFSQYFSPQTNTVKFNYPQYSSALALQSELAAISAKDDSIAFLNAINEIFTNTPFKLAYRALNELLLNVWSFQPQNKAELQAVWDDFLMFKILPRLEGDQDKLAFDDNISLLDKLEEILKEQLSDIWQNTRVDFLNEDLDGNKLNQLKCRSCQKLEQMKKQLERQQFTTFWQ